MSSFKTAFGITLGIMLAIIVGLGVFETTRGFKASQALVKALPDSDRRMCAALTGARNDDDRAAAIVTLLRGRIHEDLLFTLAKDVGESAPRDLSHLLK